MKLPWTRDELRAMTRGLEVSITRTEDDRPNIRPLPPLAEDEARDMLHALGETAGTRTLTDDEVFLHGQLMSAYRMAIMAATLGHQGRYFVISEADIERLAGLSGM